MSKEFLIRFSRLLTIGIGVLYVPGFLIGVNASNFPSEQFWFFVYWTLLLALPVVFNWLVFEKLQFWISKTNSADEYKFIERLSGVVSVFTVILWVVIVRENAFYRLDYVLFSRGDSIQFLGSFLFLIIPVVYNYLFLGKLKYWIYDRSFFEGLKSQILEKLRLGK